MLKATKGVYSLYYLVDITLGVISSILSYSWYYKIMPTGDLKSLPFINEYVSIFSLWILFVILFCKRRSLYVTDRGLSIPKEIYRVFISVVYASLIVGAVIFLVKHTNFSRQVYFANIIFLIIMLSLWRVIKRMLLRFLIARGFHNINILIVGAGKIGSGVAAEMKSMPWWGFRVVGFLDDFLTGEKNDLPVLGTLDDFSAIVKRYFIDEVIITIPSEREKIAWLMQKARSIHVSVRLVPENFEITQPVMSITRFGIMPLITYKEQRPTELSYIFKRFLDFLVSLILIVVLSPLLVVIIIAIKHDSKGSVLYKQKRVGYKGRIFNMYKFRSMVCNADDIKETLLTKNEVRDGVIFKMKKDPRVTGVGRLLRRYSIDELPQLFNVLRGDMSLVGPRPPVPAEVKNYTHDDMMRLSVRPGMTGMSQVKGRSELTFRNWVRWDIWYVNNWSLGLDTMILWWTVPVVIRGKGAY